MKVDEIQRGFTLEEYEARTYKAQKMMEEKNLDALFITTEAIFRYFSGFHSRFWESQTRPWFLIIPAKGKPVAVVPSIGEYGLKQTWIDEVHSWDAPHPTDDGVSLLIDVLKKYTKKHKRIGAPLGQESFVRMPYKDFKKVQDTLDDVEFVDVATDIHRIRSIKSLSEVGKIKTACKIANIGFDLLPGHAKIGQNEHDICRRMTIDLFENGADKVPYLIIGTGQGGYESIILGPTDRVVEKNDILIIDTGLSFDGYFVDFCRNYVFGKADDATKRANEIVYNALEAGFKILRPGITTTDVFNAMWEVLKKGGADKNSVGRIGHGLGSELTEWPSHTALDNTPLEEGMVITLEPGMDYGNGKSMVHEECVLITAFGGEWLSRRASPEIITIDP